MSPTLPCSSSLRRTDSPDPTSIGPILVVSGDLDLATVDALADGIDRAAGDLTDLGVDVSGVTFCDVVGATALEQAQRRLGERGCGMTLIGADGPLRLLASSGLFATLTTATQAA